MTKIQAVSDPHMLQKLAAMIADVTDPPWHLKPEWIVKQGWVAVPVEKGRHFEANEAETVSQALQALGCTECLAIATEPMGEYPHCYRVPCTKEGLLDFSHACAGTNFVLIPEDLSWAILCTSEDYNVFAGPLALVESALGTDISTALARFRAVAADAWWESRLLEVLKKYTELPV